MAKYDFNRRILTSLPLGAFYAATLFFKGSLLGATLLVLGLGLLFVYSFKEFEAISLAKGGVSFPPFIFALGLAYLSLLTWSQYFPFGLRLESGLWLFSFLSIAFYGLNKGSKSATQTISTLFFASCYTLMPIICFAKIAQTISYPSLYQCQGWLLYAILVPKSTDIGGWAVGSRLGRRPLAKKISPKKTIEGTVAGLVLSTLTSLLLARYWPLELSVTPLTPLVACFLGLLIGILAQIGDLFESLFKRDAGVKDSSALPGLGGILDLMDSLTFTIPFIYWMLSLP